MEIVRNCKMFMKTDKNYQEVFMKLLESWNNGYQMSWKLTNVYENL